MMERVHLVQKLAVKNEAVGQVIEEVEYRQNGDDVDSARRCGRK